MMPGRAAFSRRTTGSSSATISTKLRPPVGEVLAWPASCDAMLEKAIITRYYNFILKASPESIFLLILPFADSASVSGLCRAHSSNDSLRFVRIQLEAT
jgi:hypothetical protein